jgi:starch phosphorylase
MGYGLFYDAGFFRQDVQSGHQLELPDKWLVEGKNPWGVVRQERTYEVPFFGHYSSDRSKWQNPVKVPFIAHDAMVPSYDGEGANTLRLWKTARKIETGDPEKDALIGLINERLYPSNRDIFGKNLRFMQEYALVSASVQDILDCHLNRHKKSLDHLPEAVAIQLNDTHPALAIPELIRLLVDEYGIEWKEAVEITRASCFYTNHTVMPEALEECHVAMVRYILPRHYTILERLQADLMNEVQEKAASVGWPQQEVFDRQSRVSIIHQGNVHMARLAAFFTKQTNGVARMHSELVAKELIPDLPALHGQDAVANRTNGISHRSWLVEANPGLASLLTDVLGSEAWVGDLSFLNSGLKPFQNDASFREQFQAVKRHNKETLAAMVKKLGGPTLDPGALFDMHVKRFHEYKRQFMNALHVVALYLDILEDPGRARAGTVKIFAGKAAPDYLEAKNHIALINWLANRINDDSRVGNLLKVFFIEDYRVSLAKTIIPAANLSEQISLAGKEASGTSNMKFALNGALTIGTLDGANVEIREKVGPDNFFLFGHTKPQLDQLNARGYDIRAFTRESRLYTALVFLQKETPFGYLAESIWQNDPWRIAADFVGNSQRSVRGYWETQNAAHELYQNDPAGWLTAAIINTRGGSHFSSDDTIRLYVEGTWKLGPKDNAAPSTPDTRLDGGRADCPLLGGTSRASAC